MILHSHIQALYRSNRGSTVTLGTFSSYSRGIAGTLGTFRCLSGRGSSVSFGTFSGLSRSSADTLILACSAGSSLALSFTDDGLLFDAAFGL